MNINIKIKKKRYQMNINLLGTDLVPFGTHLYSYGYAQKIGVVPNGTKVKICVLVPWKPWLARLLAIGTKGTKRFCVFLCIYAFFVWAHDRQSRYKQKPPKGNTDGWKNRANAAPKTARDCRCYNPIIFHSLAKMLQNAPEKFWLWQNGGLFGGISSFLDYFNDIKQCINPLVCVSPSKI